MTLKKVTIEEQKGTLAMLGDEKEKNRQLEEKMTKKGSVIRKVVGQQYEPNQNHEDKVKPKREQQQGGGPKEHGVRLKATYGPGPL